MTTLEDVKQHLRSLLAAGLSFSKISQRSGLSRGHLHDILNGRGRGITLATAQAILKVAK